MTVSSFLYWSGPPSTVPSNVSILQADWWCLFCVWFAWFLAHLHFLISSDLQHIVSGISRHRFDSFLNMSADFGKLFINKNYNNVNILSRLEQLWCTKETHKPRPTEIGRTKYSQAKVWIKWKKKWPTYSITYQINSFKNS